MIAFWQTPMGRAFFEHTLPQLIAAIKALTAVLARLIDLLEGKE